MPQHDSATQKLDELIAGLDDGRGDRLAEERRLIRDALPDVVETWKWMASPVGGNPSTRLRSRALLREAAAHNAATSR